LHTGIIDYIQLDASREPPGLPKGVPFNVFRDRVHQLRLVELYRFETKSLRPFIPSRLLVVNLPTTYRHLTPACVFLFHKLCYLEDKLFRYRLKLHKSSEFLISSLIELLESKTLLPSDYLLLIETERLFSNILEEPQKLIALKQKYQFLYHEFRQLVGRSPSPEQQRRRVTAILSEAKKSFNSDIGYFPPTSSQHVFERLVFLPNSCCSSKLNGLIQNFAMTKPQDFMTQIFDIGEVFASEFGLRDNMNLSIVVTLLLRVVFDEVYPDVDSFKLKIDVIDILGELRDLTVKALEPPLEYCPPMDDNDRPGSVLRSEPNFRLAIDCLDAAAFYTNPLDIIYQFHQALKAIEQAADKNLRPGTCRSLMLPFDVTFGLLLCCLLGSAMPEYVRIAEFTKLYAPKFLNTSFEFALAKMKAATAHLTKLCQEKADRQNRSES
jgi:hypothetical protein